MMNKIQQIKSLVLQMKEIEKEVVMGIPGQMSDQDPEYSQQLGELKLVTDDLRNSMWCAFISKNSPDKVKEFVERHRMNRVIELLRGRLPQGQQGSLEAEWLLRSKGIEVNSRLFVSNRGNNHAIQPGA